MEAAAGFIAGVTWNLTSFKKKNALLTNPLSTIFSASFDGLIFGFGAMLVSAFIPEFARSIVPIALGASSFYYFWKWINKLQ
jgi:hypothetical protein